VSVTHHLRGYDRRTGLPGFDDEIPASMLSAVREVLPATEDDPGLIDPHELTRDQTVWLAGLLGGVVDPQFDYFVEAEEDWRVVAAIRESQYAEA
jgi:hypothetical protein